MKDIVSDKKLDEIIYSLNKFAIGIDKFEFGLPIDKEEYMKNMKNMIKKILENEKEYSEKEKIAIERFEKGEPYSCSTFINEDTIIAGYGTLNYDFFYPLPSDYIKKIYGTTSWTEYLKNKK